MMKKTLGKLLLIGGAVTLLSFGNLPKGWFKAGSAPGRYEMGTEARADKNGQKAAMIRSADETLTVDDFGTLMQNSSPGKYLGKRVRMSGYMKSQDVTGWGGFWFRTDGENSKLLSFDNMSGRAVKGTTGWKKYEIVLDVPNETINMAYGALLCGKGRIWFDELKFEVVNNDVPATTMDVNEKN